MGKQPYECGICGAIIWSDDPFTNSDDVIICSSCRGGDPFRMVKHIFAGVVGLLFLTYVIFRIANHLATFYFWFINR